MGKTIAIKTLAICKKFRLEKALKDVSNCRLYTLFFLSYYYGYFR